MKKVLLLLVVIAFSCKKDDAKPAPAPTPTPAPVTKHYELNVSLRPAAYTQTASPYIDDQRDSSYYKLSINGVGVDSLKVSYNSGNVVMLDSVKTGDKINISIRMRTYTKNAKEAVFRLNKAWLMSPEVVLSSTQIDTVAVGYSNSVGTSSRSWEFTAP